MHSHGIHAVGVSLAHHLTLGQLVSAETLPVVMQFLAAAGIGIGLMLWLAGRRMVRGMFAIFGLVTGGGTGFFASAHIGVAEVANVPTPLVGLLAGALVGLLASVLMYRAFMAIGSAAVLGLAAVLGAGVMTLQPAMSADSSAAVALTPSQLLLPGVPELPDAEEQPSALERLKRETESLTRRTRDMLNEQDVARIREVSDEAAQRALVFGKAVANEAELVWGELTPGQQTSITLWGLVGVGIGFLLGMAMPGRSSMLVTSVAGAAIWLPCSLWLGSSMGAANVVPQWGRLTAQPPMFWLGLWIVISLFGVAAQWVMSPQHSRRKRHSLRAAVDDGGWDGDE